jgi:hypothetical protein
MMTEILPGQWILQTPIMLDQICAGPRQVVRRSGKRVYFKNRHGEDEGQYCAVGSVLALCDSKAEADDMFAISQQQAAELHDARLRCKAAFEAMFT